MRNIFLISMLCGSFTVLAGDAAFTVPFKPGFWAGEATYYHGGVCNKFFFAAEIPKDGKSIESLTPPGSDPQDTYQRYILSQEGNLAYALRFKRGRIIEGELRSLLTNKANVQIFEGEQRIHGQKGQVHLKFTSINDTQMEVKAFFNGKLHGELILHWLGDASWSKIWVGTSMYAYNYNLRYHWESLQKALTFGYHSEL